MTDHGVGSTGTPHSSYHWMPSMKKKSPQKKEIKGIAFDESWIPSFYGNVMDWLDRVVECSGMHPRLVAQSPMVLMTAGVSVKLLTPKVLRNATLGTLMTAKGYAARHNKLLKKGKAVGYLQINDYEWLNFLSEDYKWESARSTTTSETPKDSKVGKKKSRHARPAKVEKKSKRKVKRRR